MSGKGKRRPSAPLATTSDEDSSPDSPRESPRDPPKESPLSPRPPSNPALSPSPLHDHDYENVSSPGSSSTASGPTYARQPGFAHHGHEFEIVRRPKVKKKKANLISVKDGIRRREPTPPKLKPRREPLPMRMRALPQSFWQQPNTPHNTPPGVTYPSLPSLFSRETCDHDVTDVRPITPPSENESDPTTSQKRPHERKPERKITVANTDLLFRLFDNVEKFGKDHNAAGSRSLGLPPQAPSGHQTINTGLSLRNNHGGSHIKRGRPRKAVASSNKTFVSGEDPHLVECVTEKLFPQLTLENSKSTSMNVGNTTLHVVTLREGDKCVTLPSLSVEQNYSQMLSELVMHI